MPEPKITATLKNALIYRIGKHSVFTGDIYGDVHKRWPDGSHIRTSLVDRVENGLAYTLNSIYKIEPIDKDEKP